MSKTKKSEIKSYLHVTRNDGRGVYGHDCSRADDDCDGYDEMFYGLVDPDEVVQGHAYWIALDGTVIEADEK